MPADGAPRTEAGRKEPFFLCPALNKLTKEPMGGLEGFGPCMEFHCKTNEVPQFVFSCTQQLKYLETYFHPKLRHGFSF